MDNNNHNEDFDIIDFELNEYDDEFAKEEQRLQLKEARKAASKSRKQQVNNQQNNAPDILNKPNRDMLKTILMLLFETPTFSTGSLHD